MATKDPLALLDDMNDGLQASRAMLCESSATMARSTQKLVAAHDALKLAKEALARANERLGRAVEKLAAANALWNAKPAPPPVATTMVLAVPDMTAIGDHTLN